MGERVVSRRGFGISLASALAFVGAHRPEEALAAPDLLSEGDRLLRAALFDPAERSFRGALARDARCGPARLGLARTLHARQDLQLAHAEVEAGLDLSPTAEGFRTLAALLEHSGDPLGAAEALDTYVRTADPAEPRVRVQRAIAQRAFFRLAGQSSLRVPDGRSSVTLPFDIVNDKILVKVSLNGRIPTDVVLDTGADHLVLSDDTVSRAGLRRAGGGGAARGPEMALVELIDFAGLTVRRVPAIVRRDPLPVMRNRTGEAFSPVSLGLSMIVDYGRRELTLARRLPFEPADVELPLHVSGLPIVVGAHGDEAVSFVIDTGADVTSVSHTMMSGARLDPSARRIPVQLFDAWGHRQPEAFLLTPGLDLSFGAIELPAYPVVVRSWPDVAAVHGFEMGGILGHNFLRRFRVAIDLARRVVRLGRTG